MNYIIIFVVLLILSALFSGSETALFAAKRDSLKALKTLKAKRTLFLLDRSQRLLITILIGNTLVNIAISTVSALLTFQLAHSYGWNHVLTGFMEVIVITTVILIFGEIVPKTIALRNPKKVSMNVSIWIRIAYFLFFPVTMILYAITLLAQHSLKMEKETLISDERDIKAVVRVGHDRGALEEKEKEIIDSLIDSTDTRVREIMVPRPDMLVVDANCSFKEIIHFLINQPFARLPVFRENLDNIIGFIFIKDILGISPENKESSVDDLLHPPLFVPESRSVSQMITLFQEKKTKIAIVVDEYGGTSGLVTLEDAVEEIIGDIQDEDDQKRSDLEWLTDRDALVNATANLDDLEEEMAIRFPKERNYDTLGGFIMEQLERIPQRHDSFRYQDHIFVVDEMENKRILRIRISNKNGQKK